MGVHWTPSWSSILHLLLHIAILQNVWQLFCIHLTARKRKTRSSAKVKEQYNSPVLAPSWQQQTESSSSRRWWSRQPKSGPGRSTLQSGQPLSPPPETSHSERGSLANGENLPCWDCGCWWGPPPPKAQYSYKEEQSLEDVFSGIHESVFESVQLVLKMKNEIKDWVWTILNVW